MVKRRNGAAHQVAALPVHIDDERVARICLVTSRSTSRWIIPKGWPMDGLPDAEAARIEAVEEAGIVGPVLPVSLGSYTYWRRTPVDFQLTRVDVYPLQVERQKKRWKERGERKLAWVGLLDAADRVLEPELSTLLVTLPAHQAACDFLGKGEPIRF